MCNLYQVSPKQEIERHFRLIVAAQARPAARGILTNNARLETVAERPT